MAEAGNAVFRAIADFARARREARGFAGDLKDVRGEAAGADRALDDLESSSQSAAAGMKDLDDKTDRAKRGLSSYGREALQTAAKVTLLHRAVDGLHRAMRSSTATVWAARIRAGARAAQDAYNSLHRFRGAVDAVDRSSKRMIGSLLRMVAVLAAVSVATTALTSGAGGILSLLGAAAALSGVLGLIPGALGLFGAGLAAVIIGTQGFGAALGAIASGDAAAFETALKDLTPAAQATARAIWDMRPAFSAIKKSVQEALFKDLAPIVRNLGERYLPLVQRTLTSVAGSLNLAAREIGGFLGSASSVGLVDKTFASIERTARNLVPVGVNLTSIFLDFATAGSELMAGYATEISNATGRWREFIREARESGKLKQWISDGVDVLKMLGSVAGNVGSILYSIFKAGTGAGYSFLNTLDQVTERLANFFKSAEGQHALTEFLMAAAKTGKALVPVLEEIFRVIGKVAPILADLGARIAPGLAKVIHGLGVAFETARPGLEQLASAVGRFLGALGNAGPLVGAIANGISAVLTPAITILAAGIQALTTWFNALPGPVQSLIGGLAGLVVVGGVTFVMLGKLIAYGKTLKETFIALRAIAVAMGLSSAFTGASAAAAALAARARAAMMAVLALGRASVALLLTGLRAVGVALLTVSRNALLALGGLLRMTGAALLTAMTALATGVRVVAVAMWSLTAAALANPLVLIALAIAAVALLIILNWDRVKAWFTDFWAWLGPAASTAWADLKANTTAEVQAIKGAVSTAWADLKTNTSTEWQAIKTAVSTAWADLKANTTAEVEGIKSTTSSGWANLKANTATEWQGIKGFVSSNWDIMWGKTRESAEGIASSMSSGWQRARDAVVSKGEEIGGWISALPGRIRGWLGNLGGLLWGAGQDVVNGFIRGLISLIGNLAATAARLAKAALDGAKRALGIGSPSKEFADVGQDTTGGFVRGLLSRIGAVKSAVQRIADAARDTMADATKRGWLVPFAEAIAQVRALAKARAEARRRKGPGPGMVQAEDGSWVNEESFYGRKPPPPTLPPPTRTRALQDRLASTAAVRDRLAGMRAPDVNVSSILGEAGDQVDKAITVIFNVTNPEPEPASDTAARELRTLAQMGALG